MTGTSPSIVQGRYDWEWLSGPCRRCDMDANVYISIAVTIGISECFHMCVLMCSQTRAGLYRLYFKKRPPEQHEASSKVQG